MSSDQNDDRRKKTLSGEIIDIDDILLDSHGKKDSFQKKSRQKVEIRGIKTARAPIINKKFFFVFLILITGYGVIYLLSPSGKNYIEDSSFNKLDMSSEYYEDEDEDSGDTKYKKSKTRKPKKRYRRKSKPSSLSKSRRSTKTYQEKQQKEEAVVFEGISEEQEEDRREVKRPQRRRHRTTKAKTSETEDRYDDREEYNNVDSDRDRDRDRDREDLAIDEDYQDEEYAPLEDERERSVREEEY